MFHNKIEFIYIVFKFIIEVVILLLHDPWDHRLFLKFKMKFTKSETQQQR